MRHTHKILLQRKPGQSHRELKVVIDWSGISRSDLTILAKNAIMHDVCWRVKNEDGPFPEEVVVVAKEQVHKEPVVLTQFTPPPPKPSKRVTELAELLKGLSEEDKAVLLGS